jgi:hypothetical protein
LTSGEVFSGDRDGRVKLSGGIAGIWNFFRPRSRLIFELSDEPSRCYAVFIMLFTLSAVGPKGLRHFSARGRSGRGNFDRARQPVRRRLVGVLLIVRPECRMRSHTPVRPFILHSSF